jgi:hypothetical protein
LTKEYYKLFFDSSLKDSGHLKFLHFDFHRFCKGDKFQALKVLIGQLSDSLGKFGQFIQDTSSKEVLSTQKGVYRVNCLDSIDRTNVAISQIALTVLQRQL